MKINVLYLFVLLFVVLFVVSGCYNAKTSSTNEASNTGHIDSLETDSEPEPLEPDSVDTDPVESEPVEPDPVATQDEDPCGDFEMDGVIRVTEENNYAFRWSLEIEQIAVKDGVDLLFDWSKVDEDMFGREIDVSDDLEMIMISLWAATPDKLEERIVTDDLPFSLNKGALVSYPWDDSTYTDLPLTEFDWFRGEVDPDLLWSLFDTEHDDFAYPPDSHTYMVTLGTGTDPGKDIKMMKLFVLDPESENTEVVIMNDSTQMEHHVRLADVPAVPVPAGTNDLTLEWEEIVDGRNALGNRWLEDQISEVVVARFEMSPDELEENFLFLEEMARGWWSAELHEEHRIALDTLVDAEGNQFEEFEDDGATWVVATFCSATCINPAPWSITHITPCS